MKNMLKKLLLFSTIGLSFGGFISCKSDLNKETIINNNLNILVAPDLSNRVVPSLQSRNVNDIQLIEAVFDMYYPKLYEYGYRINTQNDYLSLLFTNPILKKRYDYQGVLQFDIKENEEKDTYYLKTFDGTKTSYSKEIDGFINSLEKVYDKASLSPGGADIFNFFAENINGSIKSKVDSLETRRHVIQKKYRNILILFTDGYLEAGLYGSANCKGNKCYYLDNRVIKKFRNDYNLNGGDLTLKEFFEKKKYGIIPIKNSSLKYIEVAVCEMYDRSLNKSSGSQTVIPNDYEIMKVFWSDWLEKSGFKKFKLYKTVNTVQEFQENFIDFLNN